MTRLFSNTYKRFGAFMMRRHDLVRALISIFIIIFGLIILGPPLFWVLKTFALVIKFLATPWVEFWMS